MLRDTGRLPLSSTAVGFACGNYLFFPFLLSREINGLVNEFTLEAMTRQYNQYCDSGAWSGTCVQSFWNYYSPMHNLFNSPNLLQPALQNQAAWSGHLSNASQVTSRSELGGIRDDRPAGWATINSVDNPQTFSQLANNQLTQGSAFNQGYFIYQYSEDGVGKLFLVLSPDQQAFHCMGNCVNTP